MECKFCENNEFIIEANRRFCMRLSGGFSCMRVKWNTLARKGMEFFVFRSSCECVGRVWNVAHFVLAPKSSLASPISLTKKLHYSPIIWQLFLSSGAVRGGGKGELATKDFHFCFAQNRPVGTKYYWLENIALSINFG